jgi:hypothetical protein
MNNDIRRKLLQRLQEQHEAEMAVLNRIINAQGDVPESDLDALQTIVEGLGGRGYKDANDLVSLDNYDVRKSPSSRGEMDNPRPARSVASIQDLRDTVNKVAAKYGCRVDPVRFLGEVGFVVALVFPGGLYNGTTAPSVSAIEQEMVHELRLVAPGAICDLLTADEVSGSGPTSRRLIFRLRLQDVHRGDLGGP